MLKSYPGNTQPHIALWTFKPYPGLFCVEHPQHHICLPFLSQWSLFCTLIWLVEGVSSFLGDVVRLKCPSTHCEPVD